MSVKTRTREEALDDLVEIFTLDDLRWLGEQLLRLSDDESQPESDAWDNDNHEPLLERNTEYGIRNTEYGIRNTK